MPGSYYVRFDSSTLPSGYTFTRHNATLDGQQASRSQLSATSNWDDVDSDALVPWVNLSVSDSGTEAELGKPFAYTVAYTNTDSAITAQNVVITLQIPQGTTFMPASSDVAWTCPDNKGGAFCSAAVGDVAPHAHGSLKFSVLLSDKQEDVPDVIVTVANMVNSTVARTADVTLAAGEANLTVDAGIVLIEASLDSAGPTLPTSLPANDQPKQHLQLFLPSLQLNAGPAQSSSVPEPTASEPQASAPKAANPQLTITVFLPSVQAEK